MHEQPTVGEIHPGDKAQSGTDSGATSLRSWDFMPRGECLASIELGTGIPLPEEANVGNPVHAGEREETQGGVLLSGDAESDALSPSERAHARASYVAERTPKFRRRVKRTKSELVGTETYKSWQHMIHRCFSAKSGNFKNYGGRGITVCARWMEYENFLTDMGTKPQGKTLDRIDNNKNYGPDNCRWSTRAEQDRNRRNSAFLTVNGRTMVVADWERERGLKHGVIWKRINYGGWSIEDAVLKPLCRTNGKPRGDK